MSNYNYSLQSKFTSHISYLIYLLTHDDMTHIHDMQLIKCKQTSRAYLIRFGDLQTPTLNVQAPSFARHSN